MAYFFVLNFSDSKDSKSLADSGSTSNNQQALLHQIKEDSEDGMSGFDEGHIDLKYYKSHISWVVLDDYVDQESEGIESANYY